MRRRFLRVFQLGLWLLLPLQAALAESWQWSSRDASSTSDRGGLYLLPGAGSGNGRRAVGGKRLGGTFSGARSFSEVPAEFGGYSSHHAGYNASGDGSSYNAGYGGSGGGSSDATGYNGSGGDYSYHQGYGAGGSGSTYGTGYRDAGGYSPYDSGDDSGAGDTVPSTGYRGYSGQPSRGAAGQSGPSRTGVYPLGATGAERQYGSWGATGASASSGYTGGADQQPAYAPQYRFRTDPQLSKPQEADLPKFRPYAGQPGSAYGSSGSWQSPEGIGMAPAPVFRPLDKDEHSSSTPSQESSYPQAGAALPG